MRWLDNRMVEDARPSFEEAAAAGDALGGGHRVGNRGDVREPRKRWVRCVAGAFGPDSRATARLMAKAMLRELFFFSPRPQRGRFRTQNRPL